MNITKSDLGLSTSVFRKPTFTGLGLNWLSFCPDIFKINSIKTLLNRAYNVCSNYNALHLEFEFLKKFFIKNNYPLHVFYRILKYFLYNKRKDETQVASVPKLVKYITLPFYGEASFIFRKKLLSHLNSNFPAVNFRVIFKNDFTIGSFFRYKDRIPDLVCSNIVYKFVCPCCNARYVGCTSRHFRIRVFEHMGRSYRTGNFLNKMPFSAIRNHSREQDHPFSENDFSILGRFNNEQDTFLGEKMFINALNPELNSQT